MSGRLPSLCLALTTVWATNAPAAAPEAPATAAAAVRVDVRSSVGASRSIEGDTAGQIGAHVLGRKGWFTFGLLTEGAALRQGTTSRYFVAGAAGATWQSGRLRLTGLGLLGAQWWNNGRAELIGRATTESTAFVGARADVEVRTFSVGSADVLVGLWASTALDLHRERTPLPNPIDGERLWFVKGEARAAAGLSFGVTF